MSEAKICPSHDLLRFILQATTMIGAHRNIVVLLKISVFVYIFFVPAGQLSGTISCAAPIPKSWVDPSWDRPSQNRAWAPPNFGTFSCARPQESEKWHRNIEKRKRQRGEEYVSSSGKKIPKRVMEAVDCTKCYAKCTDKISEEKRLDIF